MTISRVIGLAIAVWGILVVVNSQSPSYAQGSLASPELPYEGLVSAEREAFHIVNASENAGIAIQGSGPIGVVGKSKVDGEFGSIGIVGVAGGEFGVGVWGHGRQIGVAGQTEGGSAVAGKFRMEAPFDYHQIKQGEWVNPAHGLLATKTTGVRGVVSSIVDGAGVTGVFADKVVDPADAPQEFGVNRGFLGTKVSGVHGESQSAKGLGVAGKGLGGKDSVGVYGESGAGFAGFFRGKVSVTERLFVKRLDAVEIYASKGLVGQNAGKFFKIDHPVDPENKYLVHASVESDEYKNFYDGMATLDANGTAVVTLPSWFEALNKDFRYQLTPVGAYAPLYIGREIERGTFQISGGTPGLRVSWMVTGVRRDVYASAHPVQVEQLKAVKDRGKYLSPREHGKPETRGIDYQPDRVLSLGDGPRTRTP